MKMTRKGKVCAIVLGLAGFAVTCDQLFFFPAAGPATAQAASSAVVNEPAASTPMPVPASPAAVAGGSGQPTPAIAGRLQGLAVAHRLNLSEVDDAFDPPATWKQQEQTIRVLKRSQVRANDFRQSHQLTAVLTAGKRGLAVLGGKPVRIGQTIDGFTLVDVAKRSAVFEAEGVRVELSLRSESVDD